MSGGGRYFRARGGRFNNHGAGRGNAGHGNRTNDSHHEKNTFGKDNEPFMLSGKPTNLETHQWLLALELWARGNLPKTEWYKILRPEGGEAPVAPPEPVEPQIGNYAREGDNGRVLQAEEFAAKHAMYRIELARYTKLNDDFKEESRKLHAKLTKHMSQEFTLQIKSKYGEDFVESEDPKRLVDAISSEFIGMNTNESGSRYEVAQQRKSFDNLKQRDDMKLAAYKQARDLSYRTLCQGEYYLQRYEEDAKTYEQIYDTLIPAPQRASQFVVNLHPQIYAPYIDDLRYKHDEIWPQTVEEAYERASELEDYLLSLYRRQKDRRGEDRVPVMAAGPKKGNPKGGKKPEEIDSHGKTICQWEKKNGAGSCKFNPCKYSHDIDHVGGKANGGKPAGGQKQVRWDHNSQAGGGPAPGKG